VPYRHVNSWIPDAYEWLNSSLVNWLIGSLVNWLLAGPAGPKTLPYGAVYRLPAGKHTGILTHFQTKVNKKKRPKD